VLSWSYRSLGPPAARLFRLLGLHPGPDLSAAAASLAGQPVAQVRPLLAELAHTQDTGPDRRAAIHRVFDHYLHTAHGADRLLYRHGETISLAQPQPGDGLVHRRAPR
jgi:hypothetical protein